MTEWKIDQWVWCRQKWDEAYKTHIEYRKYVTIHQESIKCIYRRCKNLMCLRIKHCMNDIKTQQPHWQTGLRHFNIGCLKSKWKDASLKWEARHTWWKHWRRRMNKFLLHGNTVSIQWGVPLQPIMYLAANTRFRLFLLWHQLCVTDCFGNGRLINIGFWKPQSFYCSLWSVSRFMLSFVNKHILGEQWISPVAINLYPVSLDGDCYQMGLANKRHIKIPLQHRLWLILLHWCFWKNGWYMKHWLWWWCRHTTLYTKMVIYFW